MAVQVQWRRGTTAENDAFTGAVGEITVDTTLSQLRIHDGTTAGGTVASGGGFVATTKVLFYQTAAPDGWTRDVSTTVANDAALRVVTTGTWGASAGTTGFAAVFTSALTTTNDDADLAAHTHNFIFSNVGGGSSGPFVDSILVANDSDGQTTAGYAVLTNGAGGGHSHTTALNVKYIDLIIASKD